MIVVDASALVEVMAGHRPDSALVLRLAAEELHAPHLIDVEVLHAFRGLLLRKAARVDKVDTARAALDLLQVTRYPHGGLRERVWDLRHNLSVYDACYVALAEILEAPLVTADAHLGRISGVRTTVEVFPRS